MTSSQSRYFWRVHDIVSFPQHWVTVLNERHIPVGVKRWIQMWADWSSNSAESF